MNIPFSKVTLAGNEYIYLNDVLKSGWLTTSSKAIRFEELFAKAVGAKYACAVNSCTSALHLAVESIGIKTGDKVLVPSLTFTASAEVLRYVGADPIFLDVDYYTRIITPSILKAAIKANPGVKALILVHYGGLAPEMTTTDGEGILDICRQNNIYLIEDAAHAFPTKSGNRFVGSFGDITCFSFYANKTITTGEGGMLVTDDVNIYNRVKVMRLHGINRDVWERYTSNKSAWVYDVVAPGFKYNMPDVNAAIGLAQLEKACYFREQRQRCAEFYLSELNDISEIDLPVCIGPMENHSWHLFPIIIRPGAPVSRDEFIEQMTDLGIGTSVHYKPLHRMSYYKDTYNLNPDDFPNTEKIWNGTVSLPIYTDLKNEELEFICQEIRRVMNVEKLHRVSNSIRKAELKQIWLSPPHMGLTEQKYVKDAFDTNWIAPLGPNVDEFEETISKYCNIGHVAAMISGTAAIHLALILLGVSTGDEVIASSFTFSASVNPIVYLGATPILVDSEADTWNMCPDTLEKAIKARLSKGKKPKAIILVHLYGMPANLGRIMEIANRYEIPVIEDAAEALGSRYKNKPLGIYGRLGILSFNGNKIITTSGGGAIISNDKELITKARFLSKQARDEAPYYQHSQIGYNYRLSNVLAGIGVGQMEIIDERVNQRRENFYFYKKNLEKFDWISFLEEPDRSYFSNHWLTTILIDPLKIGKTWADLQSVLAQERIESRPLWKPMHMQPVFSSFPSYLTGISEDLFSKGLCLPSGSNMTDEDRMRVLNVIDKFAVGKNKALKTLQFR